MQLDRTMGSAVHSTAKNSQTLYAVFVSCNRCSGVHEMGISVALEGGPFVKQSVQCPVQREIRSEKPRRPCQP